jgi:hypothetical protein
MPPPEKAEAEVEGPDEDDAAAADAAAVAASAADEPSPAAEDSMRDASGSFAGGKNCVLGFGREVGSATVLDRVGGREEQARVC